MIGTRPGPYEILSTLGSGGTGEDGQRFLINTVVDKAVTTPISIILNWKP